jgi:hypothetical protein
VGRPAAERTPASARQAMACQTRTRAWGFNGGPTAHGQCRSDRSGSGTMPILPNNRHELFAQGLAKGLSADAAYQAAGPE